ncbi:MAG TPA: hypothetical protein VEK34_16065 [Methylocella sp.]|nr:hypothetical protein [Methylocella sp.]
MSYFKTNTTLKQGRRIALWFAGPYHWRTIAIIVLFLTIAALCCLWSSLQGFTSVSAIRGAVALKRSAAESRSLVRCGDVRIWPIARILFANSSRKALLDPDERKRAVRAKESDA